MKKIKTKKRGRKNPDDTIVDGRLMIRYRIIREIDQLLGDIKTKTTKYRDDYKKLPLPDLMMIRSELNHISKHLGKI